MALKFTSDRDELALFSNYDKFSYHYMKENFMLFPESGIDDKEVNSMTLGDCIKVKLWQYIEEYNEFNWVEWKIECKP